MEDSVKHVNMKSLAEDDRPREKMLNMGRHGLSDAELIAILLGSGSRKETAVQLARRLLSDYSNNINELARLSASELQKYKGVGKAKAITIAAAFELGRRRADTTGVERVKITSSAVAYQLLQKRLSDLPHEEFWLLFLNRANHVMHEKQVSKGGISGTVVDTRLICRWALEADASGVVIAHNHPSGQTLPSDQDRSITKKLKEALKLFDIALLDHLIIGDQKYLSFSDEGML
jgi:DNA repair protein RadC